MSEQASSEENKSTREKGKISDREIQSVHAQLEREKAEPTEGFAPIPIFILFVFAAVTFWAGVYIGKNSADFRWDVFDPNFDPASLSEERVFVFDPIARGRRVYTQQCAQCHQADGQGVPGLYPPLVATQWVLGTPEVPTKILLHGLAGEIVVNGNTYNGQMPAFGASGLNLSPRDIGAVLTFIRQEWGNDAAEIDEDFVVRVRDEVGPRTANWSAAELLQIHPIY
jgi:mono/diheme cytochrome c family protein